MAKELVEVDAFGDNVAPHDRGRKSGKPELSLHSLKDFGGHNWCSIGDRIAFAKYGGFIIEDPEDGVEYRLLNDEDVCAVITEKP